MTPIRQAWILTISLLAIFLIPISYVEATTINFAGDVGQKSTAITNIKKFCGTGESFYGLGDYAYSKSVSSTSQKAWDLCHSKRGVQGNHECEKGQSPAWAAKTFGFSDCKQASQSAVNGNVAFIGINQYQDFKVNSKQYNRILVNTGKYNNATSIDWIVYAFHEPGKGLGCSGSHCHADRTDFYKIYEPIFKQGTKSIVIDGHTHLTGMGTINGVKTVQCGASGEGGTTLASLKGFAYGSSKTGYCHIDFQNDKATVQHISPTGQVLHTHTFNK